MYELNSFIEDYRTRSSYIVFYFIFKFDILIQSLDPYKNSISKINKQRPPSLTVNFFGPPNSVQTPE